jgi:diguanylate cyclase (GGDEF)-like protein
MLNPLRDPGRGAGLQIGYIDRMNPLRSLLLSAPRWQAVALIAGISILISVLATVVALSVSGAEPHWGPALFIAVLIPLLVAPACSWPVIGIMHELEKARGEAMRSASTDLLTGILSRRRFIEIAEQEFSHATVTRRPLAVILFDIDNFKTINDQYGHRTGDDVLALVAKNCRTALRPGDHLARWGGEEFVVLLPGSTTPEAISIAQRLRAAVNASLLSQSGQEVRVSASIGLASTDLGIDVLDRLLVMADRAMYDVKRTGKNSVLAAGLEHRTGSHAAFRRRQQDSGLQNRL